jgi:predicted transcriptional regulator
MNSEKKMKVKDLIELVKGNVLTTVIDPEREIKGGCGADLMSDVLASIQPNAVLLTGLCNPQVIRTAMMADVTAVVIVRGKNIPKETVELAQEENIPLISTPFGMFELCGRLYMAGLPSLEKPVNGGSCGCE